MSSDFYINYTQLKEKNLVEGELEYDTIVYEPVMEGMEPESVDYTYVQFVGYPYKRDCELSTVPGDDGDTYLRISCGGTFRTWLKQFLEDNNVKHEMH